MSNIILKQGDCLELMKELPDESVDAVITDPPYNVGKAAWDIDVLDLLEAAAKECVRIIKNDGQIYWFVPTRHLLRIGNLINQYIPYRWTFIWNTPNNMLTGDIGFSKYTAILIFSNAKSIYRNMQDLKSINWQPTNIAHPTPKPVKLIRYLIEKVSKPHDTILDPFMGSGTTGVACVQLNRNFIGYEISPDYFKIAEKRIGEAQAQKKLGSYDDYQNEEEI